jgi:hypothetical protein
MKSPGIRVDPKVSKPRVLVSAIILLELINASSFF